MSADRDFIQFNPVQLSGAVPEDTTALREACTTLAAHDLHTSYTGTDLIGSNGNVSVRRTSGFVTFKGKPRARGLRAPQNLRGR